MENTDVTLKTILQDLRDEFLKIDYPLIEVAKKMKQLKIDERIWISDSWTSTSGLSKFKADKTNGGIDNIQKCNDSKRAIELVKHKFTEEYENQTNEKNKPLQDFFYSQLRDGFKKKFASQADKNTKDYISNRKKIDVNDVDEFITAFPTYFASFASDMFSESDCSDFLHITKIDSYSSQFKTKEAEKINIQQKFKGALLGHTLSPWGDTIYLLMELGRFKRIETVLGIKGTIILANTEWSMLNQSVLYLVEKGYDENELKNNLNNCLNFREQLYGRLGYSVENNNIAILEKKIDTPYLKMEYDEFNKQMLEYAEIAQKLEKNSEDYYSSKNVGGNFHHYIENLISGKVPDIKKSLKGDLSAFKYSVINTTKPLQIIQSIFKDFEKLSKETFEYVFLQRYAQHNYSSYLKIGTRAEFSFDKPYSILDQIEEISEHELHSIYFHHYICEAEKEGSVDKNISVIPYYFPSGGILKKYPNPEEAYNHVISIFDISNDRKRKIREIIQKLPLASLAIQACDLFSFIYYFFKEDNIFLSEFLPLTQKFDEELYDRIQKEINNDKNYLQEFGHGCLDIIFDRVEIPYFYYPYAIAIYADKNSEANLEEKFRTYFTETIHLVLKSIHETFHTPEWIPQLKNNN